MSKTEPEGPAMSERMAAMKAALISVGHDLKAAEARVEALRQEHAELLKNIEEAATPKA